MNFSKNSDSLDSPRFKALLNQCIHCGLCLQSCPTYAVSGTEMESPRGRIALMRAASEGRIELEGAFDTHISLCLVCRSCEQACPSGVQYGALIERARVALRKNRRLGFVERFTRWLTLRQLLPHPMRLRMIAWWLRLYQELGIQNLVRRLELLPGAFGNIEALLPRITDTRPDYQETAPAIGVRRGVLAFFHGCVQDAFLGQVNDATIKLLQRNGYEVHFPEQTCCGAAHLHSGEEDLARELARNNIDRLSADQYDAIINNAGGCGATMKEYAHLLSEDPDYAEKAGEFSRKVKDINEFLFENLLSQPKGVINARVTYVDSCHLRHVQKIIKQPRELLNLIPGIEVVEVKMPDRCCGSAGVYNIVQADTSNAILDEKMADIASTGADIVVTTNTGCYFQLLSGIRREGLNMQVVHLVELLDRSYEAGD